MTRSKRVEQLISVLLVAAVVLVAANAALAFHAERVLADTEAWVAHTWEVIAGLGDAIGLVKDAEGASRNYLITGDSRFLAAFEADRSQLPADMARLRGLVPDNPAQATRIGSLTALAQQRMSILQALTEERQRKGAEAAYAFLRQGAGVETMDRLRTLTGDAQREEHRLLRLRLQASARARIEARASITVASALDVLFIVLTVLLLRYERQMRRKASETAARLQKLQAITEVGLANLNIAELTSELLARLRQVAEIDGVALGTWKQTELEITAAEGVPLEAGVRMPVGAESPLAACAASNRPITLQGAELAGHGIRGFSGVMRSVLILPLSASSRVVALVVAGRHQENAFSREDEQLLSVVADRIALAIDRASLFEAEQAARRQAEAAAAEVSTLNAELEQRVALRTAELEATNRELEAFSYSVSHDLRAPLRSVDGFSVALAEDYGDLLTGEGKHYLARIRSGVQRMGQLIDALLQLSRITRSEMTVEPVDLSELAGEVALELEHQNQGRSLEFLIEPALRTEGDPRLLRAVFENMLGNAVKFTANVAEPRIAFGYSPERDAYFIRDNGAGFDQQYAGKLFVAFQRLHGEKDFKGSGIGLATVARVIRRHHGTMSAEGAIGAGATFWFTLGKDKS